MFFRIWEPSGPSGLHLPVNFLRLGAQKLTGFRHLSLWPGRGVEGDGVGPPCLTHRGLIVNSILPKIRQMCRNPGKLLRIEPHWVSKIGGKACEKSKNRIGGVDPEPLGRLCSSRSVCHRLDGVCHRIRRNGWRPSGNGQRRPGGSGCPHRSRIPIATRRPPGQRHFRFGCRQCAGGSPGPLVEPRHGEELAPVKDALSRLQMSYAEGCGRPARRGARGQEPGRRAPAPPRAPDGSGFRGSRRPRRAPR